MAMVRVGTAHAAKGECGYGHIRWPQQVLQPEGKAAGRGSAMQGSAQRVLAQASAVSVHVLCPLHIVQPNPPCCSQPPCSWGSVFPTPRGGPGFLADVLLRGGTSPPTTFSFAFLRAWGARYAPDLQRGQAYR